MSICLSVYLSIYIYLFLSIHLSMSTYLFPIHSSISVSIYLSIQLYIYLSTLSNVPIYLPIYLSVYLSIYPIHLIHLYLSIINSSSIKLICLYTFICLSFYFCQPSIYYLSIYLSDHLQFWYKHSHTTFQFPSLFSLYLSIHHSVTSTVARSLIATGNYYVVRSFSICTAT